MRWRLTLIVVATFAGCEGRPGELGVERSSLSTIQQGIDRASEFTTSEAMSLKSAYGITFTGVYIGGPCSAGSGWTASGVTALANTVGWTFLPIFVGQQASSICGRSTLTEAQGITDGSSALTLMNKFMWAPNDHIPIALDVEAGTASATGATSYIKGFADTVSAGGYDVYVYSSVSGLNALATANLPITGGWAAIWDHSGYTSGLTPASVPGLDSYWTSRGGAWQYASGTSVVGSVDYDVANFPLAPAPGQLLPLPDAGALDGGSPADAGGSVDGGGYDSGVGTKTDMETVRDAGGAGTGGVPVVSSSRSGCSFGGAPDSAPRNSLLLTIGLAVCTNALRRRRRESPFVTATEGGRL